MLYYDEKLQALQKEMGEQTRLTAMAESLRAQQAELSAKVQTLSAARNKEQKDVDRLEHGTLAAFFYGVIGKKDEKLTKERREAYEAAVKHDAAVRELAAVESDLRRAEDRLRILEGCAERYAETLAQKSKLIKDSHVPEAEEILRLEERQTFLANQRREIAEAIAAGKAALDTAEDILSSLNDAEGWGTFDLIGGGLLADIAKYSSLDEAQASVNQLQVQLRRFQTELTDVSIQADIGIRIDGFLQFADFFFDGLFADWAVLDHIGRSKTQTRQTLEQIQTILSKLSFMDQSAAEQQDTLTQRLNELILRTSV